MAAPKRAKALPTIIRVLTRHTRTGAGRTAHRTVVRLVKLIDVIMDGIPFAAAWMVYYSHQMYAIDFYRKGNWFIIGLHIIIYYLLSHLYGGFQIHIGTVADIIYAQTLGAVITDGIMYIIMWMLIRYLPNIPVMLLGAGRADADDFCVGEVRAPVVLQEQPADPDGRYL